jgi:uncharacterized protein
MSRVLITVCLLIGSNIFMTWAWYGHLKRPSWGIFTAIVVSWLIAFPEYLLQVPANRIGHTSSGGPLSAAQLKVIQEAITLVVFMGFAMLVLKERLRINELIAFGLIFCAVIIAMMGRKEPPTSKEFGALAQHAVPALEESDPEP